MTKALENGGQSPSCRSCGKVLEKPKMSAKGRPLGRPRVYCDECSGKKRRSAVRLLTPTSAAICDTVSLIPLWRFGPNRQAAEETIEALRLAGHLEPVDASRIATLRAIATALDLEPGSAPLWREFRMSETALRLSGASGAEVDSYSAVMRAISGESL